jgi:Activator of Hsp90 ATPase homolog 1-like protein
VNKHSFSTTISVDATPDEAFAAITDVRGWWSHDVEGRTDTVGAEFTFRGEDVHRSRIKVIALVPGRRVVWHVLDTYMSFIEDQMEWKDTLIVFEISTDRGTQVRFTHEGLLPVLECFDICSNAWGFFINNSLHDLINTGHGQPMQKKRAAQAGSSA